MKRQLSFFNTRELSRILNDLASSTRIFNSEAQFQFELAWKIKEEFDCEVRLEELSRISEGKKKDYTDIIIEKDGLRIALELKYKTAKYEDKSKNIYLKAHGAADLGAYDFLWDVHRIQLLTGIDPSAKGDVKMPCDRGYAIILTNDAHYWKDCPPKETINREFLIGGNPSGKLTKGVHEWYDKDGTRGQLPPAIINSSSRRDSIEMCKDYDYQWKQYCDLQTKNGIFKYVIVEIAPDRTSDALEVIDSKRDVNGEPSTYAEQCKEGMRRLFEIGDNIDSTSDELGKKLLEAEANN